MADPRILYRINCTEVPTDVVLFHGDEGCLEFCREDGTDEGGDPYDRPVGSVFITRDDARELAESLTAWADSEQEGYVVKVWYDDGSSNTYDVKADTIDKAADLGYENGSVFSIRPVCAVVTGDKEVKAYNYG